ncbi:MAG: tetratricopeptide repeat protein [Pseudomonadota bacterium]
MIELGSAGTAPQAAPVKDVTDQTFTTDVVEASKETPIIVDFWAPWCQPCKTLGPMLEASVAKTNGKVRMVKVNVDENQRIVATLMQNGLPMQSIPTVIAFSEGRIVDMMQGAVPQGEIDAFIKRILEASGGGFDEALEAAEQMLTDGAAADAAQTFAAILGEDPEEVRAMGGLIRATLAAGQADQARALLDQVPETMAEDPAIAAARAALDLAEQAEEAGETAELRAKVDANPDDHQARFDLAVALSAADDNEAAIEELLELFRRDREWNGGAAKEQLFKIFELLGPKDQVGLTGRRRLSSMIFA